MVWVVEHGGVGQQGQDDVWKKSEEYRMNWL